MSLVSGSIPSLANGVSQQPPWVRLASQLEAQENFLSSLVSGLTRRPGTRHEDLMLLEAPASRPFFHSIDRDVTNRFVVMVQNGSLRVFDTTGAERTVSFPDGTAYLNAANPEEDFSAVSVIDYTFVVNRTVQVLPTPFAPVPERYGYVYVRQGAYGTLYRVYVNGVQVADYTTSATLASAIQTVDIATNLATQIGTALGGDWSVWVQDSVVRVQRHDNADFTIETKDGAGDNYLRSFRDSVQSFSDLPPKVWDGTWVEVVGSSSNGFDSYYVRYDTESGSWRETVFPQDNAGPDPATMPHQLVRNPDGTFVFRRGSWEKRKSGDVSSAPDPSFVFRKISDVFFWKGRLGFLSDDAASLSAASKFFRFYPETVTTSLDSDPIDVSAGFTRETPVRYATPLQDTLMLWAENVQFELVADGGVPTPSTVSISEPSSFPSSLRARPIKAGKGMFFGFGRSGFGGVREYIVDKTTNTKDALDTTIHVPSYIPGDILQMASLANDNLLLVRASGDPGALYAYKFHWEGDAKLQSSWSRWSFDRSHPAEVWFMATFGSRITLVIKRLGSLWMETLEVDVASGDFGLRWPISLDRRSYVTGVYNPATNLTTWTLPYLDVFTRVVTTATTSGRAGTAPQGQVNSGLGGTITAPGNWAGPAVVGIPFLSSAKLSRITPEDRAGGAGKGRVAITDGRLQVLAVYPITANTGYLIGSVSDRNGPASAYTFTPRFVGTEGSSAGEVAVADKRYRLPVYVQNDQASITLSSDSYLPCSILSVDWEGIWSMRSRRI